MELVNVKNLTKTFEDKILFENSSFSIQKGDKIGLLGKNGSGKTTLLNILFKNETIDFGTVYKQNDLFLAYFKQNLIVDTDVFDYLIESEDVENKISLITKYLKLINMPQEILQKNMSQISGGEITKLQLIKIFISKAEFLILDEPTNHLDLEGTDFLINWLKNEFRGTYIIVSHNRDFLKNTTNKIIEINLNKIIEYNMTYLDFIKYKKEVITNQWDKYNKSQKEINRLEASIDEKKQWIETINTKTGKIKNGANDESLSKKIGKMNNKSQKKFVTQVKNLDKQISTIDSQKPYTDTEKTNINFFEVPKSYNEVLIIKDGTKKINNKILFKNANIDIMRNDKIFLIGANGTGKTTLLKIINQEIKLDSGNLEIGTNVKIGYLKQQFNNLNLDYSILDYLHNQFKYLDKTQIKTYLARFLFKGDQVYKKINVLSGGEIIKIQILECLLNKCNFLILDEPTNNLDITSITNLENALIEFVGTLLIVTHDKEFIKNVATKILKIDNYTISEINKNNL